MLYANSHCLYFTAIKIFSLFYGICIIVVPLEYKLWQLENTSTGHFQFIDSVNVLFVFSLLQCSQLIFMSFHFFSSGHATDAGARAGLRAEGADVWLQAHETAAPEAAHGLGEQTERGDGRTQAETGQRAGGPEEQLCSRDGETHEEKPSNNR